MKMNIWKISTFALAGLLALVISFSMVQRSEAEKQPRMRMALNALQFAKDNLQQASRDKGGHRVKALRHVDEAMKEVRKGIRFDNRHSQVDGEAGDASLE